MRRKDNESLRVDEEREREGGRDERKLKDIKK